MGEAHEELEKAEHAEHASGVNKQVALLIAVMALFLALSEMLGKSANTEAISLNIKVSDTWNFFQAKTIRRTILEAAAEAMKVERATVRATADGIKLADLNEDNDPIKAASKQIAIWEQTAARYRSEPDKQEGTIELQKRAEATEHERDTALARYHNYEIASAAFQIGIVLCSAAVITGMILLAWVAAGVAVLGMTFTALGLVAPHALHLG
ncbi:MAG TPA: DUF4337 domain-containing protein [Xanthobacteraceae bacterium]|nr:DUF4337 domain-containing protein [Xanthobacteraceae bacterium]